MAVNPLTTPASKYPVEDPRRQKLNEYEVYERLDNVVEDELIEVVIWQGTAMKAQLIVTEAQETDLLVQSKHGECRLPKANMLRGNIVGLPSLHRDGDSLGVVEYVLREEEIPHNEDPSQSAAGYNL